ncbi:DUF2490 domain-containing protein [Catalinimonas niigatensis]|uniref:DUF2490 domain-containing protein n=1 Tax=Catalinimonas niigatensis TaxID=1397264 RepID=UPI00266611B3|nr:DUF2490 domain-containing protein [Catalinimonas niigatensis]WPP53436.1 DUF2490 domain-containing protein [Catalinimonas niigatensis]
MHKIPFLLLLLMLPLSGFSQSKPKSTTRQELLWFRYYNKLFIGKHWLLHTELDVRRFVFPGRQHQWVLPRIYLDYKFSSGLDLGMGGTYFLQALPQIDSQAVSMIRHEIRPHQEVNYTHSWGSIKASHRVKIEERFFLRTEDHGRDFNFRFRYKFQVQVPLSANDSRFPVSLVLFDEIMFNAGKSIKHNVFDQNRIYAGFQNKLSDHWTYEVGYMNWYQQRASGQEFFDRHIIRFTLTHSLKVGKG